MFKVQNETIDLYVYVEKIHHHVTSTYKTNIKWKDFFYLEIELLGLMYCKSSSETPVSICDVFDILNRYTEDPITNENLSLLIQRFIIVNNFLTNFLDITFGQ